MKLKLLPLAFALSSCSSVRAVEELVAHYGLDKQSTPTTQQQYTPFTVQPQYTQP